MKIRDGPPAVCCFAILSCVFRLFHKPLSDRGTRRLKALEKAVSQKTHHKLDGIRRETILGLKADLVVCKWDTHEALLELLDRIGIKAVNLGPETLELFGEARLLGRVTGNEKESESLIKAITNRQVFVINGDEILRCGSRMLNAFEQMIDVVYPESKLKKPQQP